MNKTIEALEAIGKTATFSKANTYNYSAILNPLNMDVEIQQAIAERDVAKLEMMLNVRSKIVCMVTQPEPDESPAEQPEPNDDEQQEKACC
ncbi:hypothetical protein [Rheinheimera sp. NSM]|uniref:hypothetical protein n=1 Tax=Rheinheimera sp. NSM TaxID=3457884 RepID=UPI0040364E2C